jgi:hypothetical protein
LENIVDVLYLPSKVHPIHLSILVLLPNRLTQHEITYVILSLLSPLSSLLSPLSSLPLSLFPPSLLSLLSSLLSLIPLPPFSLCLPLFHITYQVQIHLVFAISSFELLPSFLSSLPSLIPLMHLPYYRVANSTHPFAFSSSLFQ